MQRATVVQLHYVVVAVTQLWKEHYVVVAVTQLWKELQFCNLTM